jgi:hypothetical protein
MVGLRVVVRLKGGSDVMAGTVVSLDDTHLVLELSGGARVTLSVSEIVSLAEGMASDPTPAPPRSAAPPPPPIVVYVPLRRMEVVPSHRTRYFYAPSAMTLRQGEGYFSQKEILFSAVAVGATDNLSILLGSVLPFTLFGDGLNGIVALKYGWQLAPKVHVAVAGEALAAQFGGFGLAGGLITYGDPHNHATLVMAYPFAFESGRIDRGDASLFALAGTIRTGRHWALVSENWLVNGVEDEDAGSSESFVVYSIGLRRFGMDHAFDLALVGFSGLRGMFPWFDWTFSWGQRAADGRRVLVSSPSLPPGGLPPGFMGRQNGRQQIGLR